MSGSPPSPSKGDDKAASPIESIDMDTADAHAGLAGFDYEGVKEQDRWLPIANGTLSHCLPRARAPYI